MYSLLTVLNLAFLSLVYYTCINHFEENSYCKLLIYYETDIMPYASINGKLKVKLNLNIYYTQWRIKYFMRRDKCGEEARPERPIARARVRFLGAASPFPTS